MSRFDEMCALMDDAKRDADRLSQSIALLRRARGLWAARQRAESGQSWAHLAGKASTSRTALLRESARAVADVISSECPELRSKMVTPEPSQPLDAAQQPVAHLDLQALTAGQRTFIARYGLTTSDGYLTVIGRQVRNALAGK